MMALQFVEALVGVEHRLAELADHLGQPIEDLEALRAFCARQAERRALPPAPAGASWGELLGWAFDALGEAKLDPNRPIYSPAETYVDLFVGYRTRMFGDKVRANFQINVKNVTEDGGSLQATSAFFDGRASTYRIVDPRQFIFSASFDL